MLFEAVVLHRRSIAMSTNRFESGARWQGDGGSTLARRRPDGPAMSPTASAARIDIAASGAYCVSIARAWSIDLV
jgi:hypothetical protein